MIKTSTVINSPSTLFMSMLSVQEIRVTRLMHNDSGSFKVLLTGYERRYSFSSTKSKRPPPI